MEVYIVKHEYYVDGGFGDAVPVSEILCGFVNKAEAEAFVSAYENPHVYDDPYEELTCGELVIEELTMTPPSVDSMWWLRERES
jgi:hypothetical protein